MIQKSTIAIWFVALHLLGGIELLANEEKIVKIGTSKCAVIFEGARDKQLLEALTANSHIEGLSLKGAPHQPRQIDERKLQAQKERWLSALLYLGYLDGQVQTVVQSRGSGLEVRVIIHSGPLYILKNLDISVNGAPLSPDLYSLLPQLPCPARTPLILTALERIVDDYKNRGYPFAQISQQEFVVEEQDGELDGKVQIASGPFCLVGEVKIEGLRRVTPDFVLGKMLLQAHEPIDFSLIAKSRKKLEASGLFSSVSIGLKPQKIRDTGPQFVDLKVDIREARPRSLGFGVNISSQQKGVGLIGEWSHRNLRGLGENVTLNSVFSRRRHKTTLQYAQPFATHREHVEAQLRILTSVDQDATRDYDATSWNVGFYLDQRFGQALTWSQGVRVEQIATRGAQSFQTTALLGFPLALTWSNTADLFNPTSGSRIALLLTPCIELSKQKRMFSKQELLLAQYFTASNVTFAFSMQLANFWRAKWFELPPSLRYYLGSSSSMRGYPYKSLSPLDEEGQPRGGSSLMGLTFEPRVRVHPKVSLVPFFELGRVFDSSLPKFNKRLYRSAGLGAYLFTPIGPLRFDLAFPLDRRPKIDRYIQLYMSMGSAF